MINWTRRLAGVLAIATLACSTALAAEFNLSITSGGSDTVTAVPCGAAVTYEVRGVLSEDNNLGLAAFSFDLKFTGGPLEPADAPVADPMLNFDRPAGIAGPEGFGGKMADGRLVLVGGAQNTINNTPDNAPYPIGSVLTGVAHTEVILVTGSLATPAAPGTYTLSVSNLAAAVIQQGQDGTDFWTTEATAVGRITNLTVHVPPADPPALASNDGPVCSGEGVTLLGGPNDVVSYYWTGPSGFTSTQQNPTVSPAVPGIYTLSVTDVNNCSDTTTTTVALIPGLCQSLTDCNGNGTHDECDIRHEVSHDCNENAVPDECDISDGASLDCQPNRIPDECDLASGASEDCDTNRVPDECDLVGVFTRASAQLSPIGVGSVQSFSLSGPPEAAGNVTFALEAFADLGSSSEQLSVALDGVPIGTVFSSGANDCPSAPDTDTLIVGMSDFNAAASDGYVLITIAATSDVNPAQCDPLSYVALSVEYAFISNDCNDNSVLDTCDIAGGTSIDCNSNHFPDECDIAEDSSDDCNTNSVPDECERGDFDGDGVIDVHDFAGLQRCFTGEGAVSVSRCCRIFDYEGDEDVDLGDYARFESAFTGPSGP